MSVARDAAGWTVVTPSSGARLIHVAANGSDTTGDGSEAKPYATINTASKYLRNNSDDELLFRRGDTFRDYFGYWGFSGVSPQQPFLIGNYGDPTLARPVIDAGAVSAFKGGSYVHDLAIIGVDFTSSTHDPTSANYNGQGSYGFYDLGTLNGLLIEDCRFRNFINDISIQGTTTYGPVSNVTIRRSQIVDAYNTGGNSQGMYAEQVTGLTIQENVFDHNGWSTLVPGATANIYSHDCYLHSSDTNCVITGNLFANASSHGLQARGGGIVDNNLFLLDPTSLSFGLVNGSTTHAGGVSGEVIGNVFLKSRALAPSSPGGIGAQLGNLKPGGGTTLANNVFADDTQGGQPAIQFAPGIGVANPQQEVGLNTLVVEHNIVHNWGFGMLLSNAYVPGGTGAYALNQVVVRNNDFQNNLTGRIISHQNPYDPRFESWSGNRYASNTAAASWFTFGTTANSLAQWQKGVEPTAIATTVPYVDGSRTVETYMAGQGLAATTDSYLAGARSLSKGNWDPRYLATAVVSYVQGGYVVDTNPPAATFVPPPDVTTDTYAVNPAPTFTVTYDDDVAVDPATIASGNLTIAGPGGFALTATLVGTSTSGASSLTATYQVTAPNGDWTTVPYGTYVVTLGGNQVKDKAGNAVAAQALGSFQVTVNADATPPAAGATTPINFTATPAGTASIALAWSDPAADQRSYVLTRALDANFTIGVKSVTLGADATSYVDASNVSVGTTYYYSLTAVNPLGASAPTAAVSVVILPAAPALSGIIYNDGNAQRATVTSITLNFTRPVAMDATMIDLLLADPSGVNPPTRINATVSNPSGDGRTWVASWASNQFNNGLPDGSYTLVVHAAAVHDAYGQAAGSADQTWSFNVVNPPVVTSVAWQHLAPPHTLAFTFNQDVSATLALSSLTLKNGGGTILPAASYAWDPSTLTATFTFSGALPDGNYRAEISAATTNAAGVHLDGNGDGIPGDIYIFNFSQAAPTVSLSGPANINVGAPYALKFGTTTDTGMTVTGYVVHWGDGSTSTFTPADLAAVNNSPTHTYANVGTAKITVDVIDANGTHLTSGSTSVAVNRATVAVSGYGYANPYSLYTLTIGAVNDTGYTVSSYIVHWGDNTTSTVTAAQLAAASGVVTHTYGLQAASQTFITVDLVDNSGPSGAAFTNVSAGSSPVRINNLPYVGLVAVGNANVNGTFRLIFTGTSDPGFTLSKLTVNWGDGTVTSNVSPSTTLLTHVFTKAGADTISVDATDNSTYGTYAGVAKWSLVVNPSPTVALTGNANANAGGSYSLVIGPANDPGQTVSQYLVNWGDGTSNAYTAPGAVSHVYASAGTATITVDVTDATGTFAGAGTLPLTINNAPSLPLTGSNNANVGGAYTLTLGTPNDPGQTVSAYTVHWGDGKTDVYNANGPVTHAYASPGTATISVDLTDATGTYAAVGTMPITISRPSVSLSGRGTTFKGVSYALTLGPAYDLGGTPAQYVIDWGDNTQSTYNAPGVVTHTYAAAAQVIVTADLVDAAGTYTNVGSLALNILPPPTIVLGGASTVAPGAPYTLNLGAVNDPAGGVQGYIVHWGDNTTSTYNAGGNVTHSYATAGPATISVDLMDPLGTYAGAGSLAINVLAPAPSSIVGRSIFYNHSSFDGNNAAPTAADFSAIATNKQALLPGQTASFANYTSYTNGINGLFVDVAGLPAGTSLGAGDFTFLAGNGADLSTWASAPAPASVTVFRGQGANGSDRVAITWPDRSIVGQWLQVTVRATANTGLAAADVFYFGNAPGETGNSATDAQVGSADVLATRANQSLAAAPITSAWDFNRDGVVNAADVLAARGNLTGGPTALQLFTA